MCFTVSPFTLNPDVRNASGNFSVMVALPPGVTGVHTSTDATAAARRVSRSRSAEPPRAARPPRTGLAFTGVEVMGIVVLGVLLLVGGAQIVTLDDTVKSASLAVRILPAMLGKDDPKRYLVAFQNEAEARGTGGLAGAFAIVEANHGKLKFRLIGSVPLGGTSAEVDFGPTALSYLLALTGPATLPDTSQVSAGNIVAETQNTAYAKFSDMSLATQTKPRSYLLGIASAVSRKILGVHGASEALAQAVGMAMDERRLLVWSADPAVQADLAQTSVAGIIPTTTGALRRPVHRP
jgi:hypothetical protein